jgi:hypothetical protein
VIIVHAVNGRVVKKLTALFAIADERAQSILFMGIIFDPAN